MQALRCNTAFPITGGTLHAEVFAERVSLKACVYNRGHSTRLQDRVDNVATLVEQSGMHNFFKTTLHGVSHDRVHVFQETLHGV